MFVGFGRKGLLARARYVEEGGMMELRMGSLNMSFC